MRLQALGRHADRLRRGDAEIADPPAAGHRGRGVGRLRERGKRQRRHEEGDEGKNHQTCLSCHGFSVTSHCHRSATRAVGSHAVG